MTAFSDRFKEFVDLDAEVLGVSTDTVFVHKAWINTSRDKNGEWRDAYAARGLRVVAIHLPREEAETDVARVRDDAARRGITEPLGIDNAVAVADAFDNKFVPAYFLFDREGLLRSRSAGDAGLGLLKGALARQLGDT